jgi:hypothetical protein
LGAKLLRSASLQAWLCFDEDSGTGRKGGHGDVGLGVVGGCGSISAHCSCTAGTQSLGLRRGEALCLSECLFKIAFLVVPVLSAAHAWSLSSSANPSASIGIHMSELGGVVVGVCSK